MFINKNEAKELEDSQKKKLLLNIHTVKGLCYINVFVFALRQRSKLNFLPHFILFLPTCIVGQRMLSETLIFWVLRLRYDLNKLYHKSLFSKTIYYA